MKRSEMVEILRNSFINNMNSEDVDSDEMMYSNILQDLEDAGMEPPIYEGVFATGEKYDRNKHHGRDTHRFKTWEPE